MDSTKHLQQVILSIMRDVDDLCVKNNISYYLLGGSALGAIRHKGFIPWDDDLDICMTDADYKRFIELAKQQLDPNKYYVQEGLKDWPMNFSKVKLKGTYMKERNGNQVDDGKSGIFLDVFKLDASPNNLFLRKIQYVLAKYYTSYQLGQRNYTSSSLKKRLFVLLASPLKLSFLRRMVTAFVNHWNGRSTNYLGFFYGRTTFKTGVMEQRIYGTPIRVPFEDMMLPVPEKSHEYLAQMFGDYMTPPPPEKRVGLHLLDVDFGNY